MEFKVHELVNWLPKILSKKEMYVVNGILYGKTQTDISGELHLSKVRISQIKTTAFEKIRSSPMAGHLKRLVK